MVTPRGLFFAAVFYSLIASANVVEVASLPSLPPQVIQGFGLGFSGDHPPTYEAAAMTEEGGVFYSQ